MCMLLGVECVARRHAQSLPAFESKSEDYQILTNHLEGYYSSGVCGVDVNGDGRDDLSFGDFDGGVQLWLNTSDGFQEQPLELGIEGQCEVKGVIWGDVDNDGDQDLFVGCRGASNRFFKNEGDLQMVDVSDSCGLSANSTSTWGASWVDLNHDGFLDLIVAHYLTAYGYPNTLYLGQGDGTFVLQDLSDWGLLEANKASFQWHWVDFNSDNRLDLYLINDKANGNEAYIHTDSGFVLLPDEMGLHAAGDVMGSTWLDMELDGDLEVYLSDSDPYGNKFLSLDTNGQYVDLAPDLDMVLNRMCWGCSAGDWDCDGYEDLYVSTANLAYYLIGSIPFTPVNNTMYYNQGEGLWSSWESSNPEMDIPSFNQALLDWNEDGFLDMVVHTVGEKATMMEGIPNGNHWLDIVPAGVVSNRDGIGLIVHCYVTNGEGVVEHRVRQLASGESFMMQNARRLHFGLGASEVVDSLHAVWPSGVEEWLYDVPTDLHIHWVEGSTMEESEGCTYAGACNYDPFATSDDGSCDLSCLLPDCLDLSSACGPGTQWDAVLQMCLPEEVCWHDSDQDGNVTTQDLLGLLSVYGSVCP